MQEEGKVEQVLGSRNAEIESLVFLDSKERSKGDGMAARLNFNGQNRTKQATEESKLSVMKSAQRSLVSVGKDIASSSSIKISSSAKFDNIF